VRFVIISANDFSKQPTHLWGTPAIGIDIVQ